MNKKEYVCVCHRVSLGKLQSFIMRKNPKVASQLSECLGSGTSCGWCIPFLEKLHKQHLSGETMELTIGYEGYTKRREVYKQKDCANDTNQ